MIRDKFGSAQLQAAAVVAGDRAYAKLQKGRSNRYLLVTAQATLTISVAVTAILGLGSVWQLFDLIGMDEGGGGSWQSDPRFFIQISEMLAMSKRTATRVTSLSASPVTLREQILIPFEYLNGAKPGETRFRERDISVDTQLFYVLNGVNNGIAKLVTGGTATITNVTVTVQQYFDNDDADPTGETAPLFRPWFEQKRVAVVGASPNLTIDVTTKDLIEGITVLQNTTGKGMVTDIINKIGLTSADTDFLGRGQLLTFDEFARSKELEFGGDVYAGPAGGIVHHSFRYGGRLSNLLNPNQANTIQLQFDAQPSGVAGAVASEIVVLFSTLQRYPFQRTQDGVWITAPVLPASLAG
jgi:hypothetical protein